jgi:hypothetical protein
MTGTGGAAVPGRGDEAVHARGHEAPARRQALIVSAAFALMLVAVFAAGVVRLGRLEYGVRVQRRAAVMRDLEQSISWFAHDKGRRPRELAELLEERPRPGDGPYWGLSDGLPSDPVTGREFGYDPRTGEVLPPVP